jgi:hypothetical protein
MTADSYKKALSDARIELTRTIAEREELDAKITQLRQTIRVLGDLCREDPDEIETWASVGELGRPSGITSAVRSALQYAKGANENPLTVPELRNLMANRGFDFTGQANPMASITTIVKRLRDAEEVDECTRGDGKRAYAWKADVVPQPLNPALKRRRHYRKAAGGGAFNLAMLGQLMKPPESGKK